MAVPQQCPECGRFLSKSFVSGLVDADAPCPKCESVLTAPMFGLEVEKIEEAEVAGGDAAAAAAVSGSAVSESVRPPDLDPADLGERDVLAGWDLGGGLSDRRDGVVALPFEAAVGIGAVCAIAGFAVARKRPGLGAVLGAASGLVLSAVYRTKGGIGTR